VRPYPQLMLRWGTQDTLSRYRAKEPGLVSSARDEGDVKVVLLEYAGAPQGVVSFFLETNTHRATRDDMFARIDLVIVPGSNRGHGVARALVLCVLGYLLSRCADRLYSVSCLAAHDAIEKILRDEGFVTRAVPDQQYTHAELALTGQSRNRLRDQMTGSAARALRALNYHLRQREGRTGRQAVNDKNLGAAREPSRRV